MTGIFLDRARGEGKRARTRARLMDAATEAFARHGIEGTSVNEIAQGAEVANGTFYNHFRDRDEIADTVGYSIAAALAQAIDEAMTDLEDPAERVSFGTRQFIELATVEPMWGRTIVRASSSLVGLRRDVTAYARADIDRGFRSGVFKVEPDDLFMDLFASMGLTGLRLRLEEDAGTEIGARVAEHQLRLLGVSRAPAHRAAFRPIPPLLLS